MSADRHSPAAGGLECFVGRERELGTLGSALQDAAAGRGRIVMVAGEPGIGKTRLAAELARSATNAGATAHWGRCWEEDGAPPFWPWIEIIRLPGRGV